MSTYMEVYIMIKGLLFDVDGTLVLSNDAHAHAWEEAFAEFGYEVPFGEVRKLMGMGGDKLIVSLFPALRSDMGDGKLIAARRKEIFLTKYAPYLQPAPGARQLVEAAQSAGLKTIVASSATSAELSALLKAAEVDDLLKQATTSDDAENSKPDPDIVQVALQKIGLSAGEVGMIGDTPYDISAAKKAGVACVTVKCGGSSESDLSGSHGIYKDPADLLAHKADFGM